MSGTPNVYPTIRPMNFSLTEGAISDTSGNLLFYTNGCYIANALNNEMYDGDSLNPGSCIDNNCALYGGTVQDGNLILPAPGYKDIYYLFHESCDYSSPELEPSKLYYSIVDMSQQGGLGAVIEKNQVIINNVLTIGFLSAVKHANGRDWWIVTHNLTGNIFYTLLLTPDGIQGPYTQTFDPIIPGPWHDGAGQTEFSPDGSKLATSTWWSHYNTSDNLAFPDLHLFDFNRCTGLFSNHQFIYSNPNQLGGGGGLSFSPSSRFLYLVTHDTILQFDLNAADITGSKIPVATNDTTAGFLFSQLAYDGKIYISDGPYLILQSFTTINSPDSLGLACDVQLHNIQLPSYCEHTLPNYPNYRLGALTGSSCDSLTGINEQNIFQIKLNIFPNPSVEGFFHFQFNDVREKIKELEVTDITGRIIYSTHKSTFEIDISFANSGIYFYSVQTSSGKFFNGKLIKE